MSHTPATTFLRQAYAEHAEYVKQQGHTPFESDFPGSMLVPQRVALRAIELAQEHAQNYRENLARALLNAQKQTVPEPSHH